MVTAAHVDAAASSSHKLHNIFVLISYLFTFITEARIAYDRNTHINIGKGSAGIELSAADIETITAHNIFRPPSQTSWTTPGKGEREQG